MIGRNALRAARALIATPATWSQGARYRDVNGEPTTRSRAVRYCTAGAVEAVTGLDTDLAKACRAALDAVAGGGRHSHVTVNDDGSHADVLAMFDRAIAAQL